MDVVLRTAEQAAIFALLARYHMDGTARVLGHDVIYDVLAAVDSGTGSAYDSGDADWRRKQGRPVSEDVTAEDAVAVLRLIPSERMYLNANEMRLIEAARDRGETWRSLAEQLGYGTPQALQQHYRRIGGRGSWPRPA